MLERSVEQLLARAERHAGGPNRFLLGITGAPGAGKSTLAERVAEHLGDRACVVGMDGFHLAQCELERLGRAARKGAIDTFDAGGYVALLRRLRASDERVVYAPRFRRDLEEPIGSSTPVARRVPLVITEGNYLLAEHDEWREVRPLLDEVWYVRTPDAMRRRRLVARHVAYGKAPDAARAWVARSDERNAELIEATRHRADLIVELEGG